MIGRKDAIRKAADMLENEMDLLGITGVEDKLLINIIDYKMMFILQ